MECPFCSTPLVAGIPECPACRVTFPRTATLLGAVPRLTERVSASGRLLGKSAAARIRKALDTLAWRFPQVSMQVVLHEFPETYPFSLYAFWLFNASPVAGQDRRGADNHSILLLVDPKRAEAALQIGYGLEPYVSREALDQVLGQAVPAWRGGRWEEGVLEVIAAVNHLLEGVAQVNDESAVAPENF